MRLPPVEILLDVVRGARIGLALVNAEGRYLFVNEILAEMHDLTPDEHAGATIDEVVPELAPAVRELMRRALDTGEPVVAASLAGRAGSSTGSWEASYIPVRIGDREGIGILVADTTERDRAVAETRRRLSQQEALADLGQLGLREADPDAVLAAATEMVVRELGADMATAARPDPVTGKLAMAAGTGFPPGHIEKHSADETQNPVSHTMLRNEAIIAEDALNDERTPPVLRELGVRSVLSVPIPGSDGPWGVLSALARAPGLFAQADVGFMRGTANVIGASVVRTEHEEQLARLAAYRGRLVAETLDTGEREQRQLADLLHEDVLQHLLFARLEVAGLEADEGDVARVTESLDNATRLVREVVTALRPPTLSHAGLVAALEVLCRQAQERSGVPIELEVGPGCEGVADDLVHSAVRELLDEVVTQAGADRAHVTVATDGDGLAIRVTCEGSAVAAEEVQAAMRGGSIALASLHERTVALGGRVAVTPAPGGRGTAVELSVPH